MTKLLPSEDENHTLVIQCIHLILSFNSYLFSSIDLLPICLRHRLENRQFGFSVSLSVGSSDDFFTVEINLLFDAYYSNHLHPLPSQEGCQFWLW